MMKASDKALPSAGGIRNNTQLAEPVWMPLIRLFGFLTLGLVACPALAQPPVSQPPVSDSQGAQQQAGQTPAPHRLVDWKWFRPIPAPPKLPSEEAADLPWVDFVIPPSVFTEADWELDDLRVHANGGEEVPYALRVRRGRSSTEEVSAEVFNRSVGSGDSRELSLDLGETMIQHNEIEVEMPGSDFRRHASLDGSSDGQAWQSIAEKNLIRFERGKERLEDLRLQYPPGRFRYLRLRVHPDPAVDDEPVEISHVTVRRRVELAGEDLTLQAAPGPREATREEGAPASAWIIPLGGEQVPVSRIEVEVAERDFVRDYVLESAGPPGPRVRFQRIASGTWRRRMEEPPEPLTATFNEVRAARLRLIVIDHSNPPLTIEKFHFAAPARQVVLPWGGSRDNPWRLYYGNPDASPPRYDFARNLPEQLVPPPLRTELEAARENPAYIPPPVPVTERWPWMIYVVLAVVSLVLAAVILSVARTTIAWHDADSQPRSDAADSFS